MKRTRVNASKVEATAVYDLTLEVMSHHLSCTLFIRSKSLGTIHTVGRVQSIQMDKCQEARAVGSCSRRCLPQVLYAPLFHTCSVGA